MATMLMSRYDVLKVDGLESDDENKSRKRNRQKQTAGSEKSKGAAAKPQQQKTGDNKQPKAKDKLTKDVNQEKKSNQNNTNRPALPKQQNKPKSANVAANKTSTKTEKQKLEERWEEWIRLDESTTAEAYEKDMHEALIASRMEFEQAKQVKDTDQTVNDATESNGTTNQGSKKKKSRKPKNKPPVMSLDEFNDPTVKSPKKPDTDQNIDALPLRLHPEGEANPNFFDDIDSEADTILQIGKAYDEYQKQFAQESVRVQKLDAKIKRRNLEIQMLRTSLQKKEEEFQQVKKRNKQLCVILGQGEMKEKAEILLQADSLSQVNSELTEQVTELTGELERERSKVHALESDIERMKTSGRHSGK